MKPEGIVVVTVAKVIPKFGNDQMNISSGNVLFKNIKKIQEGLAARKKSRTSNVSFLI